MGSISREGNCCEVGRTMMWLARIDVWMATGVTCLLENGKKGGHLQKLCSDSYASMFTLAVKHIIVNLGG